ncbi:MFS transporter [Kineosporia sp. J2-2]|uniref:MFS transporter n=1 Tax=Kineosporia corallincola TaxID=2835133 RepID=A0ABS5TS27_9ACTN|nr:MFS transporter [Kineosporia corallincola]
MLPLRRVIPRRTDFLPAPGPGRHLLAGAFVNSFGSGLFHVVGVIYLVRVVGLPLGQVGAGLSVAGVVGLAVGIPVGHLADRFDPRRLAVVFLLAEAVWMALLVVVRDVAGFLLVATLSGVTEQASRTLRSVLTGRIGGQDRARLRAMIRSATNLSVSLGALAAGVAVQFDTSAAYRSTLLLDALTFALAACVFGLFLPRFAPVPPAPGGGPSGNFPDVRYLAVTAVNGVMTMHYGVLATVLPIWVVQYTRAPAWVVSGLLVLNTVMIVMLQVAASRAATGLAGARRWFARSGAVFLITCSAFALTAHLSAWWATVALLVTTAVYTLGELWHAAASFEFSYELAPDHAIGRYQGVFGTGVGAGNALAPVVLLTLCPLAGGAGWVLAGLIFAVAGVAIRLVPVPSAPVPEGVS